MSDRAFADVLALDCTTSSDASSATRIAMTSSVQFLASDPDEYEHFMARWSRCLAGPFLQFAGIRAGERVLDVGCGTGVLTLALAEHGARAVGIDASEPYLDGARRHRSHREVTYELADARHIPYADDSFDGCVSILALDVIPEVDQVVREMRRVTRSGGVVASGVFDFWGGFAASDLVCDTGSVLDEGIRALRDRRKARPLVRANGQAELWSRAALVNVIEVPIVISFDYTSFEDYWSSFSAGPSALGLHVQSLSAELRAEIQRHVRDGYMAGMPDGPRSFATIVRAVRGTVPQ
jgi:SAM-dependent methyltransferase